MVRQNINDAVEFKKGFNGCVEALADYTWKYINGTLTIR